MAPIFHLNHQTSHSAVPFTIMTLDLPRLFAQFDGKVNDERLAVFEFAKSQWDSVKSRAHYTMNADGITVILIDVR